MNIFKKIQESYFFSAVRKDLFPYYDWGYDRVNHEPAGAQVNPTAAIELFARTARKLGAKEKYHSSKKGSKFDSSIYLVLDGVELRISDHELPYTKQRDSTKTRWDGEVIFDDYTVDEMLELKTKEAYFEW